MTKCKKKCWGRCAALTAQRPNALHLRRPAQRAAASEADGAKELLQGSYFTKQFIKNTGSDEGDALWSSCSYTE